MFEKIKEIMTKIKKNKPLVLNITNDVTMDFVANGLLSLGASPVMSKAEQEIEDLVKIANSVVINIGTLTDKFIDLCSHACLMANTFNKPIILDPVGVGASCYRTDTCLKLINNYDISIIRGNASEIMSLSDLSFSTKGVDSTAQSECAMESAKIISMRHHAAIVISGKTDVIIDADSIYRFDRGSSLMPTVTGTGCLLSAVVGAFHAVEKNRLDASAAATIFYGICGEIAEKETKGPGSFKMKFIDALNSIPTQDQYDKR